MKNFLKYFNTTGANKGIFHCLETLFSQNQTEPQSYTKYHGIKIINLILRIIMIRLKGIG